MPVVSVTAEYAGRGSCDHGKYSVTLVRLDIAFGHHQELSLRVGLPVPLKVRVCLRYYLMKILKDIKLGYWFIAQVYLFNYSDCQEPREFNLS